MTDVTAGREGFPVWQCSDGHHNDMLRSNCRACGEHRPCEHWRDGRRCGKTPVSMYFDGPKCHDCRPLPPTPDWEQHKQNPHGTPLNDYVAVEFIRGWNANVYARPNTRKKD